ncbi:MAG: HDOD domain-containing protein [Gammaproteobacteria bacterium]|nr:HDOD domain-containing protein [Gammaproteobacteria bacterium]
MTADINDKAEHYLQLITQAINNNQLILPSLPEVAFRVKQECEKANASVSHIVEALTEDPALAVRLMHIANSALYKTRSDADDLKQAVTRLGLKLVKNLVISLAMKHLFQSTSSQINELLKEQWLASTKTAAMCQILAQNSPQLNSENALLAGLTHNIGSLPVLLLAEDDDDLFDDTETLCLLIKHLQGEIGSHIFQSWNFPDYLSAVALHCYEFDRQHPGPADYIDLVQVALVESSIYTGLDCPQDWSSIPAFDKLGVYTDNGILEIEENRIIFEETAALFN